MATTDTLVFSLTALRPNGTGLPGASVRILNANHDDVTAVLFGATAPLTDASGNISKSFTSTTGLPLGQTYTIQVVATGYTIWETGSSTAYRGEGVYVANLVKSSVSTGDYITTGPDQYFASSLYTIMASTLSPSDEPWEIIRYRITHLDNRTSLLEAPVDPVTKLAICDLHSRARLHPLPILVPDNLDTVVDTNFSDVLSVTTESMTEETTVALDGTFSISVANMVPDRDTNDLGDYGGNEDELIKWITFMEEPVVNRNFYFDVLIWLSFEADYVLHTSYFNGAHAQVGTTELLDLTSNQQAQRIKINPNPNASVRRAELYITLNGTPISETLNLIYRG